MSTRDTEGVPWLSARRSAYAAASRGRPVIAPLEAAGGAVLAEPLLAEHSMPGFDTAAMDGYALASEGSCRLVGTVLAGDPPGRAALRPHEAVRIATGAPVPAGARHVLRQEDAQVRGEVVDGPAAPAGAHIRRRGEDADAGEVLAPAGASITAALLGLAAASGHSMLTIIPPPRVVGIVTGDEVAPAADGGPLAAGQLRDAIGPMLPALVPGFGARLDAVMYAPDRPSERLAAAIRAAGDDGAEVVLVSGATSVGPADGLRAALRDCGGQLIIDSVACRPGHPQLLARIRCASRDLWVVGLPGNPFAALIALHTLAAPLMARLAGRAEPVLARVAPVGIEPTDPAAGTRLIPVTWDGAPVGGARGRSAASLRAAACADALAAVPPGWAPGESAPAIPLGGAAGALR